MLKWIFCQDKMFSFQRKMEVKDKAKIGGYMELFVINGLEDEVRERLCFLRILYFHIEMINQQRK